MILVYLVLACLWARLAARLWGPRLALGGGALLFLSYNIFLVNFLGFSGLLTPLGLAVLHGAGAGLAAGLGADFKPNFPKLNRFEKGVLGLALALWAYFAIEGALLPPLGWDGLSYHLTRVFYWLQEGRIASLPFWLLRQNAGFSYPAGGEALYLLQAALTKSQVGMGQAAAFYPLALFLLALGGGRAWLLGSALAFLTPVGLVQTNLCYVDWALAFFGVASALFLLEGKPFPTLLAAGAAASVKYHALPILGLIFAVALLRSFRKRQFWKPALGLALGGSLFVPWLVWNWRALGSPIWGLGSFPYTYAYQYLGSPILALTFPLRDLGLGTHEGGLGPLFWFGALPLVVWGVLRGRLRDFLALAWLFLFLLIPGNMHTGPRLVLAGVILTFVSLSERVKGLPLKLVVLTPLLLQALVPFQFLERKAFLWRLEDLTSGRRPSPMVYYKYQFPQWKEWARLDRGKHLIFVNKNRGELLAPLFGSQLQNRLYFTSAPPQRPARQR